MDVMELICIRCPKGCLLRVELEARGEEPRVLSVSGNSCPRGDEYARKEICDPTRAVTSSVPVRGCALERMVSVKTERDVPKGLVLDVVNALVGIELKAPVRIGDVVLANVCDTGVDVVATKDCLA